jgi:Flp pilus assembly protein TadB
VDFAGMPPHEAFAYALEEIKNLIQAEFRALRAEIKLWRESK